MSPNDLTTLAALKAWLGLPPSASPNDATLAALISAASRAIYSWLSRPGLLPQTYSEVLDAQSARISLRHWPVSRIASLTVDDLPVPPVVPGVRHGYLLQSADAAPPGRQQAIDVFGRWPLRGRQNIAISYIAGYGISAEAQTVPSSAPWQVSAMAPYGPWASDLGIVYAATGVALTAVASSPSAHQYAVSAGVYSLSASDAGAPISISYGYIPQDIAQAALELAAERFRAAERIGLKSKSIGGQETIAFDTSAISATVLALLQPYRRVTPS